MKHQHDGKTPCPGCKQKAGIDLALAQCKAHGRFALSIADEVGGFTGAYIAQGCPECMSPDLVCGPSGKWEQRGTWWVSPKDCALLALTLMAQSGITMEEFEDAKAQIEMAENALEQPH